MVDGSPDGRLGALLDEGLGVEPLVPDGGVGSDGSERDADRAWGWKEETRKSTGESVRRPDWMGC